MKHSSRTLTAAAVLAASIGIGSFISPSADAQRSSNNSRSQSSADQLQRTSALPGLAVMNRDGNAIGEVQNAMIDLRDGEVVFAMLKFNDRDKRPLDFYMVPWRSLIPQGNGKVVLLQNSDEHFNNKSGFNKDDRPDFNNQQWAATVYKQFDVEPWWQVHEYVNTTTMSDDAGGWGIRGKFDRLFDPSKMEAIRGEVIKTRERSPLTGMSPGVELVVQTDQGKRAVVLGPRWYLSEQGIQYNKGDEVAVQASVAQLDGQPLYIAANVRRDKERIDFHDRLTGEPVWIGQATDDENLTPEQRADARKQWLKDRDNMQILPVKRMLSTNVIDNNDKPLGTVADALYDRHTGDVAYVIISNNDQLRAVPWYATKVGNATGDDPDERTVTVTANKATVNQLNSFSENNWPNLNEREQRTALHDAFGVRESWRSVQQINPAEKQSTRFNPRLSSDLKTFDGVVSDVKHMTPIDGAEEAVILVLQEENSRKRVYLAPVWFIAEQPFEIQRGDKVRIHGQMVEAEGRNWLVANRVTRDDLVVALRDADGSPKWWIVR